jgi:transposase-like protein
MRTTVSELFDRLRTEADAWEFLEELRWPNGPKCPACHGSDVYLIQPKNGVSRRTVSGSMSQRRTWNCRPCRKQFSATTGTMMHGTRLPIRTWVLVIFEMCASKNGVAAGEIERKYGLCSRSAWFLMHRIREAMKDDGLIATMRGTIVADETFIGGDPTKMNRPTRRRWIASHDGNPFIHTTKTPVLSLINAETGEVRSRVVPRVNGANLRKVMSEHVDMAGSILWTDEGNWYRQLGQEFIRHATVNHSDDQYVGPDGEGTNKLENFFSQLKRSIDGTHHHVSVEHLPRYLGEFDYRFTTRKMSDGERMADLVGRAEGRRLTYKRTKEIGTRS